MLVKHMQQTEPHPRVPDRTPLPDAARRPVALRLPAGPVLLQRQADARRARLRRCWSASSSRCSSGRSARRLQALYQAEGERQALLVETVHGMRTVKSLAMEPRQRRVWDDQLGPVDLRALPRREDLDGGAVADRPAREADERRDHRPRRARRVRRHDDRSARSSPSTCWPAGSPDRSSRSSPWCTSIRRWRSRCACSAR